MQDGTGGSGMSESIRKRLERLERIVAKLKPVRPKVEPLNVHEMYLQAKRSSETPGFGMTIDQAYIFYYPNKKNPRLGMAWCPNRD